MLRRILATPFNPVYAVIEWRYANIRIRDGAVYQGGANPASALADPSAAATNAQTTATSSLPIGTYYYKHTWLKSGGETLASPEGTFTTTAGQKCTLTIPIAPAGTTGANIYLTPTNGSPNAETLYITNTTVSTSATTALDLLAAYVEGGVQPPVINTTASYAAGVSTILVSGLNVVIPNGFQFTIAGDRTIYKVSSHTETSGVTTSVTFAPPLQKVVYSTGKITFGPHILLVKVGEGNLTYDRKRPIVYIKDRGKLDTVRLGDDEPVEVKLETQWNFITGVSGSGNPTIEDALDQTGEASTWVTSSADPCEPYAVDLEIEYVPPCGSVPREIITFPDFRYEDLSHDIKQAMISVSGKSNTPKPTVVRAA